MSIGNKLNYLSETKDLIKQAIINKGVEVDSSLPFREYASKIDELNASRTVGLGILLKDSNNVLTINSNLELVGNDSNATTNLLLDIPEEITQWDNRVIYLRFKTPATAPVKTGCILHKNAAFTITLEPNFTFYSWDFRMNTGHRSSVLSPNTEYAIFVNLVSTGYVYISIYNLTTEEAVLDCNYMAYQQHTYKCRIGSNSYGTSFPITGTIELKSLIVRDSSNNIIWRLVGDYLLPIVSKFNNGKLWSIKPNGSNNILKVTDIINYSGYKAYLVEQTNVNSKSWELFLKIKKSTSSNNYVSLINDNSHWGSIAIYQYDTGKIGCALGTGSSWVFDDAMQINFPNDDDYFYIKYSFDGNNLYELTVYDKNKVQYSHDSLTNSYKLSTMNLNLLSNWDNAVPPTGASIDLSESYLKVDGEFIQGGN